MLLLEFRTDRTQQVLMNEKQWLVMHAPHLNGSFRWCRTPMSLWSIPPSDCCQSRKPCSSLSPQPRGWASWPPCRSTPVKWGGCGLNDTMSIQSVQFYVLDVSGSFSVCVLAGRHRTGEGALGVCRHQLELHLKPPVSGHCVWPRVPVFPG